MNKEIEDGERELAAKATPGKHVKAAAAARRSQGAGPEPARIAQGALDAGTQHRGLDDRHRELNAQLLQVDDPAEALRLHTKSPRLPASWSRSKRRWCELQELVETGRSRSILLLHHAIHIFRYSASRLRVKA